MQLPVLLAHHHHHHHSFILNVTRFFLPVARFALSLTGLKCVFSLDGALRIDLLTTYPPFFWAPRYCCFHLVLSRSSKHHIPSDSTIRVSFFLSLAWLRLPGSNPGDGNGRVGGGAHPCRVRVGVDPQATQDFAGRDRVNEQLIA